MAYAAPTEIDVLFPNNNGMSSPVDEIDTSPYKMYADIIQTEIPETNPTRHPAIAPTLLVFFHITDSKIGMTADPIQIPIVR